MLKNFRLLEHFILLVVLVGIDQFSKYYMFEKAILNPGIIGGLFTDISPFIRTVILSSIGVAGVVFYFVMSLMLSHKKIHIVKIGSCIWIAGLFSNVIDRSVQGGVVDFININIGFLSTYSFNLADIFQIVGFMIFIFGVFIQFEELFYPDTNRKSLYIDSKFQKKWVLISFGAFSIFGLFLTFFAYCFLKTYLDQQAGPLMALFLTSSLTITLLLSLSVSLLTIMLTHRIVGPILALKKYLNSVIEDAETPNLKLRETDDFRDLEEFSAAIKTKLKRQFRIENLLHWGVNKANVFNVPNTPFLFVLMNINKPSQKLAGKFAPWLGIMSGQICDFLIGLGGITMGRFMFDSKLFADWFNIP